jgi:hypothetical protein
MIATFIKVVETRSIKSLAVLPIIIAMHLSYGIGELSELIFPGKDLSIKGK